MSSPVPTSPHVYWCVSSPRTHSLDIVELEPDTGAIAGPHTPAPRNGVDQHQPPAPYIVEPLFLQFGDTQAARIADPAKKTFHPPLNPNADRVSGLEVSVAKRVGHKFGQKKRQPLRRVAREGVPEFIDGASDLGRGRRSRIDAEGNDFGRWDQVAVPLNGPIGPETEWRGSWVDAAPAVVSLCCGTTIRVYPHVTPRIASSQAGRLARDMSDRTCPSWTKRLASGRIFVCRCSHSPFIFAMEGARDLDRSPSWFGTRIVQEMSLGSPFAFMASTSSSKFRWT
jgi:hypothetical protein